MQAELERAMQDVEYRPSIRAIDQAFTLLLSDFGYEVEDVFLHFRGTYMVFSHGACSVTIEIDPKSRDVRVDIRYRPEAGSAGALVSANVWDVLAERDPTADWSPWPRQ